MAALPSARPDRPRGELGAPELAVPPADSDDPEHANRSTDQAAPLGELEPFFGIDVLVQSKGRTRAELSEDEFSEYIQRTHAAIDSRRR